MQEWIVKGETSSYEHLPDSTSSYSFKIISLSSYAGNASNIPIGEFIVASHSEVGTSILDIEKR